MDKLLERYIDFVNQDEEDRIESIGRGIVDRIIGKYGTTDIRPIIEEQENWKKWREIAFRNFSPFLPGESITVREIRERLGELKNAGYLIGKGYSRLRKNDARKYFKEIRKNIIHHSRY